MNILQVINLSNYGCKGKIKAVGKSYCEVYGRETSGFSGPNEARETTVNSLNCIEEKESLPRRCLNAST